MWVVLPGYTVSLCLSAFFWLLPLYKDVRARRTATLNCPRCRRCQCDWLSVFLCGPAINCRPVRVVLHLHRQTAGMDSGSGERKWLAAWLDGWMDGWRFASFGIFSFCFSFRDGSRCKKGVRPNTVQGLVIATRFLSHWPFKNPTNGPTQSESHKVSPVALQTSIQYHPISMNSASIFFPGVSLGKKTPQKTQICVLNSSSFASFCKCLRSNKVVVNAPLLQSHCLMLYKMGNVGFNMDLKWKKESKKSKHWPSRRPNPTPQTSGMFALIQMA